MKIKIIFFLSLILTASCTITGGDNTSSSIEWERVSTVSSSGAETSQKVQMHPGKEACGVKTCALQEYLENQEQAGKFRLEKTEYYQKRFGALARQYRAKDSLLSSEEFQKFVKDFSVEYFACRGNVEKCSGTSSYTYDEQNFVWYIFLPRMVNEEFVRNLWWDEGDGEAIVQSIKEKYFATFDQKEALVQVYKEKLTDKAKNIDISSIDRKRLKEDKAYFEDIILKPNTGIYDVLAQEIPTSIIWPEKGQLRDITTFTTGLFFQKLLELWIDKTYFFTIIGTSDDVFKKLDAKAEDIDKIYSLRDKMPYDRYLRHDEIVNYVFANIDEFNKKWDFNKDVLELKHYVLLQYSFPDIKMYSMSDRVMQFNSVNNFLAENLYKYSKYMNNSVKF